MGGDIKIKKYRTMTKDGKRVEIHYINKDTYRRFIGVIRLDGKDVKSSWQDDGKKVNGTPNLNLDITEPGIVQIVENANSMWSN